MQRMLDNVDGYTLKDQALASAHVGVGRSYLGPQKAETPEERGVPKWEGSPEEAAKIIRAAMRHFGAATVGFIELDDNTRKLIYGVDPDGKDLIFTDDPIATEEEEARYIPNSCKYVIVYTVQMSTETMRRCPTPLASQTTTLAYRRGETIQASTQEFLRGLGYQCLGESSTNALGIAPALGVMAGLGELSRLNRLITPEFGPMVRVFKLLTDLPVAVDKPIDAGIMEFCKRCKKCAEACPSESLSFLDEPTWETQGGWNNPGHKAYFENAVSCLHLLARAGGHQLRHLLRRLSVRQERSRLGARMGQRPVPPRLRSWTASSAAWTMPLATARRPARKSGGTWICRNTASTATSRSWRVRAMYVRNDTMISKSRNGRGTSGCSGSSGPSCWSSSSRMRWPAAQNWNPAPPTIFWVSFVVWLLAGGVVWFTRRR